jgi:hypothetical protein
MARKNLPAVQSPIFLTEHGFSFDVIAEEHREFVRAGAHRARQSLRKTIAAYIETGGYLREVRPYIPHGYWASFVDDVVETSLTTATNCMALHERFVELRPDVLQNQLGVSVTAMIHLATAPDAAIDEVIDLCASGQELIIDQVDAVIDRHAGKMSANRRKKVKVDVEPDDLTGEEALAALSEEGVRGRLIPQIIAELQLVLDVLEDAEEMRASGGRAPKTMIEDGIRVRARWLTDALEQVTQLRAKTDVPLVHGTFVERGEYPPGPWADTASFLAYVSSSHGWQRIKADDIPILVERGLIALRGALLA